MAKLTIYELYVKGSLTLAIDKGLVKPTIPIYCEIYKWFLLQRFSGLKYNEALQTTAEDMNTSVRTVKRAISLVTK